MNLCKECGSYAINPSHHGREPKVDLDLCDVCYWRKRATEWESQYNGLKQLYTMLKKQKKCSELNDKVQYKFQS